MATAFFHDVCIGRPPAGGGGYARSHTGSAVRPRSLCALLPSLTSQYTSLSAIALAGNGLMLRSTGAVPSRSNCAFSARNVGVRW